MATKNKSPSMARMRSDLPVSSRGEYDGHTSARVDIGPSKENYSSILCSSTTITQLNEAYYKDFIFVFVYACVCIHVCACVCKSICMCVHVSTAHTETRRGRKIL